jgi:hypothetical protein
MGPIGKNAPMPKFSRLSRRAGPVGLVLTAIDLWGRLTPAQRRRLLQATRKHGPAVARAAARRARTKRPR